MVAVHPRRRLASPARPRQHAKRPRPASGHPRGGRGRRRLRRLGGQGAADRGRVGVRRPRRPRRRDLHLGRRSRPEGQGDGQHLAGRVPLAEPEAAAQARHLRRPQLPAQRLRPLRHGRQRLGVDQRLLRRAGRRATPAARRGTRGSPRPRTASSPTSPARTSRAASSRAARTCAPPTTASATARPPARARRSTPPPRTSGSAASSGIKVKISKSFRSNGPARLWSAHSLSTRRTPSRPPTLARTGSDWHVRGAMSVQKGTFMACIWHHNDVILVP